MNVSEPAGFDVLMPMAPWEDPVIVSQALKSLEDQSLQPQRVVISCDGSPPQPLRDLLARSDLPMMVIEGPGREGVGPVLARGMDHCSSELIVRADADDLSLPDRCRLQVQVMLQRPEVAALSSWMDEFMGDSTRPISIRTVPVGTDALRRFSRWRNPMNHPAVILRQSMVRHVGGYRACPGFEDYDLWLRLIHAGYCLDNLSASLVKARVGPQHTARRNGWRYLKAELRFLMQCGQDGLFSWPHVLTLALLRLPIRFLPPRLQTAVMMKGLRQTPPHQVF